MVDQTVSINPAPRSFQALNDLAVLICQITKAAIEAPKPLKVSDISLLLPMLPNMEKLIGEVTDLPGDLKAMDEIQGENLISIVAANLALTDPRSQSILAASLKLVFSALELGKAIRA